MSEIGTESAGGSTATQQTPQDGVTSPERFVTAELEAAFKDTFRGSSEGDEGTPAKQPEPANRRPNRQATAAKKERIARLFEDQRANSQQGNEEQEAANPPASRLSPENRVRQPNQAQPSANEVSGEEDAGAQGQPTTLDPILLHAAKRAGWSVEEAEALYEQDPDKALNYFTRMHQSFNRISSEFARFGNPQQQQQQAAPQQQFQQQVNQPQQQQAAQPPTDAITLVQNMLGVDVNALKQQYDEGFVNNYVLKQADYLVKNVIQPMQRMHAQANEMQQFMIREINKNIGREAASWFKGVAADFGDMYGQLKGAISDEQKQSRQQVANLADQIRVGAAKQSGLQLSVTECLERAHAILAEDRLNLIARKNVTAQVQRRSRQITARPTQRNAPSGATRGKPAEKSIEAAMNAYASHAAEIGFDTGG